MIEEEEDQYDFHLIVVDDDDVELVEWIEVKNAGASYRIHHLDAPPKKIRKRDLASRDVRIRADYFGPNPVYLAFQFR
jgi:hypothetical protein